MTFIQTISFKADDEQGLLSLFTEWDQATPGASGFEGAKLLKDRDNPGSYMVVAQFSSYELAMENSARPETDAMAKRMSELTSGVEYRNFDLIHEDTPSA